MKLNFLLLGAGCLALASANAASVLVHNATDNEDGIYALFDNQGALLPSESNATVRLGIFADGFNISNAWNGGSLDALTDNFIQFGASSGQYPGSQIDGLLQAVFTSSNSAFSNKPIVLWISNSDDFLNPLGQHLIFRFDTNFNTDPASNQVIGLNPSAGELLVGEFGNYSYDYGFSSGVLPGFNLESVIPEPSTYALVIGAALLAVAAVRRGRARA